MSYDPFNKLEKDHQEVKGLIYANLSFSLMATIRLQSEKKKKIESYLKHSTDTVVCHSQLFGASVI